MKKLFISLAVALGVLMVACGPDVPEVPANLELGSTTLAFDAAGGQKNVTFNASHAWTAEVTSGSEWLTLAPKSGEASEKATVTVTATANEENAERNGKITVKIEGKAAEIAVKQTAKGSVVAPSGLIVPDPIYRPNVLTPVDYVADVVDGGIDGVSIEITEKATDNFKFQVRPGANIQSYRLDVYPLTRLYNSLYEQMNQGDMDMSVQLSKSAVESMIRGFIFDSSGAGAFTFSVNNMEDYLSHEFDWMNTPYAQAKVVPDCEYVIAAVGCFDSEGMDQGDLTLCYVRTPYKELIGTPAVDLDVVTTYDAMQVTYIPNKDCKYFYQWVSNEDDLQPYIDIYGEKLYIDFMRNAVYDPTSREDLENHTYYIPFGTSASSKVPIMATAIGLDKNFTPSTEFQSKVVTLKERPENSEEAYSKIEVVEDRIGAGVFWLNVELGKNCSAAVMKVMSKDQAESIKNYSDEEKATYAEFLYQDGWGFGNVNYKYNRETDELFGSDCTLREPWTTCEPDTEYVIVWTAMNQYRELASLQFTDVIKTKTITKDNPAASTEDAVLNLSHTGVQQVHIEFTYNFENTAKIHFQYIEGFGGEGASVPTQDSSREELLSFLYADGEIEMGAYSANHWWTEPTNHDKWTDILDPNTTYTVAYVAEDWNGVLGEVKFATTKTEALQGGDNPVASITGGTTADGINYFQFDMGKDAMQLYYMVGDDSMDGLQLKYLGNKNKLRYKDCVAAWENYCMEYSLKTYALSTKLEVKSFSVALCIPIGGSADEPVYGALEHLIFAEGEFRDLGYYYPNDYPGTASAPMLRVRQQLIEQMERPVNRIPASELPEAEYGKRSVRFGEIAPNAKIVEIDYEKLSSHPLASGR